MSTKTKETPQVWVGCLAAYNAGMHHGHWIDATDEDEMREEIQEILDSSPEPNAEEWHICDHENFHGLTIDRYESIDEVARLGALIEQHGEAFAGYASHVGVTDATSEGFEDAYRGHHESEAAYAEELFDDLYEHEIPEHLRSYIDYERFARDLFMDGYYSVEADEGGVFVYSCF